MNRSRMHWQTARRSRNGPHLGGAQTDIRTAAERSVVLRRGGGGGGWAAAILRWGAGPVPGAVTGAVTGARRVAAGVGVLGGGSFPSGLGVVM